MNRRLVLGSFAALGCAAHMQAGGAKQHHSQAVPVLVQVQPLKPALKPYAVVKALQFDPPQADRNSPAMVFVPGSPPPVSPGLSWVPQGAPSDAHWAGNNFTPNRSAGG